MKKAEAATQNRAAKKQSAKFTAEEKAAMKERAAELKKETQRGKKKADGENDLLEKIAEMTEPDRTIAERIHAVVKANVPELMPKTWYGMPAYANEEGKIVCFLQPAQKFGTRYATFGFNDSAQLDDGDLWSVAFAVKEVTPAVEEKIAALVKRAMR